MQRALFNACLAMTVAIALVPAVVTLASPLCLNNQAACTDNVQDSSGTAVVSGNGLNVFGALYVDGGAFIDGGTTLNGVVTVGGVGGARQITLNATGSVALIGAVGTNQSFNVSPTGSGSVTIGTGAVPEVNQLLLTPSATGTATTISVGGSASDGDAGLILAPGDAGVVWIGNGVTGAGQVNHFVFAPQATGTAPILSIAGDTNQTLLIDPAGTGAVQIGSGSGAQSETLKLYPAANNSSSQIIAAVGGQFLVLQPDVVNSTVEIGNTGVAQQANSFQFDLTASGLTPYMSLAGGAGGVKNFALEPLTSGGGSVQVGGAGVSAYLNQINLTPAATGVQPSISISGDTNQSFFLEPAGTGTIAIGTGVGSQLNQITFKPAATGNAPTISTVGDATQSLNLSPAGSGAVVVSNLTRTLTLAGSASSNPTISTSAGALALNGSAGTQIGVAATDWPITHVKLAVIDWHPNIITANTGEVLAASSAIGACASSNPSAGSSCACASTSTNSECTGIGITNLPGITSALDGTSGVTANDTCTLTSHAMEANGTTDGGPSSINQLVGSVYPSNTGVLNVIVSWPVLASVTPGAGIYTVECHSH